MEVTLRMMDDKWKAFAHFMHQRQVCGDLLPDINPCDWVAVRVLLARETAPTSGAAGAGQS
jgi:hypothetical protein